jgi:hydroxymethylpyrimidine/phosphomethylpyrimidine kinase
MVPVKPSQSHQGVENSASRVDETFTAPSTEPIMKHNRIGSKRMYWVRVSIPTSKRIRREAKVAAVIDCVISSTARNDIGTSEAPRAVQNTLIPTYLVFSYLSPGLSKAKVPS